MSKSIAEQELEKDIQVAEGEVIRRKNDWSRAQFDMTIAEERFEQAKSHLNKLKLLQQRIEERKAAKRVR